MAHFVLRGKGEIQDVINILTEGLTSFTSSHNHTITHDINGAKFSLLILEKHFMRNNTRATLTIAIHEMNDELQVDAVGSGGSSGVIFNFSLGANKELAESVVGILKPHGFEVI